MELSSPHTKRVFLMRHAKTVTPYGLTRDFDRALTSKGLEDALKMGAWIKTSGWKIDRILSSSALRTRQTTELVIQAISASNSDVEFLDELYHAEPAAFIQTIQAQADSIESLLIVSHNMGITDFANQLTLTRIDHMSPGSVFAVQAHCQHWSDFITAEKRFLFFQQP